MEALVADFPDNDEFADILSRNSKDLGENLLWIGRTSEAEPLLNRAIQLQETLIAKNPGAPAVRLELCKSFVHLGRCAKFGGRREDAKRAASCGGGRGASADRRTPRQVAARLDALESDGSVRPDRSWRSGSRMPSPRRTIPLVQDLNRKYDGWGWQLWWVEMHRAEIARLEGDRREQVAALERAVAITKRLKFPYAEEARSRSLATLGLYLLSEKKWLDSEGVLRECLQPALTASSRTIGRGLTRCRCSAKHCQGRPTTPTPSLSCCRGYEGLLQNEAKIPRREKTSLNEAIERIVRLYEATGKPDQAAAWRKKLPTPGPPTAN